MPFYAVKKGRKTGVYQTWSECQEQIVKFTGAKFKKFPTEEEAWDFVGDDSSAGQSVSKSAKASEGDHGKKRTSDADADRDAAQSPKKPDLKKDKSAGEKVDYRTGESFNEEDGVVVYADGACCYYGKKGAQGGLGVFWGAGDSRNLSERLTGEPTSNRSKIHAARRAVEQAKAEGIKNLVLHTDCMYLINSITSWIKGWKKKDWVKSNGEPVTNKEDFVQLDDVMKDMNIKWVHSKGNDDNPGNKEAKKLASEGSKKTLPTA